MHCSFFIIIQGRFEWESPKTFIDCLGTFESQAKLTVRTPDLSMHRGREKLGQSSCKIRVALDGDSFTLTTTDFYFHSVTEHWASLLFGPGVLEAARDPENNKLATQEETVFVIQGKDKDGKNRTTGGDEVTKYREKERKGRKLKMNRLYKTTGKKIRYLLLFVFEVDPSK
jgi:hypothetical protein